MLFLKHSITALLALLILSLASLTITSKANAQEVKPQDQACPIAQFFVAEKSDCKAFSTKSATLTATEQILLPTKEQPSKTVKTSGNASSATVLPSVSPVQTLNTPTATLSADILFSLVNAHRKEINLPAFEQNTDVCSVAASRRDEMVREIFVTHALHAGFYAKNLPYFATENLIWQRTETGALNWWLASPIHRTAIEGHYKYACGVCNGEVCNMIFTNYDKKTIAAAFTQTASTLKNLVQ